MSTMPEESNEDTETPVPSRSQKITAAVVTALVSISIALAATGVSEKINKQIKDRILKTGA